MKKLLFTLIVCLLLMSCNSVKDDVPVQILAESLGKNITDFSNLSEASSDYIKYCMKSDLSLYSEYVVMYPFSGTKYNEIGIFKVKDQDSASDAAKELESYLMFKKSNWDTRYKGEEFSKIEHAKITTCGNYILYTILDEKEQENVIKQFQKELKKE